MQRLLAIDCDSRELGFVLATAAGGKMTLEAAGIVPLKSADAERPVSNDEAGKQLQLALGRYKKSGTKVLAEVDRNAIELSTVEVPPASDAELPELVLNQLMAESPNLVDESVIDFIPSSSDASQPRRVTAAALSQVEFNRVTSICTAAGVAPDCLLLRPYETASLFLKNKPAVIGDSLLVNVIVDEVDLIVVDQSHPLFFRTVRLPAGLGDEAAEQRLLDEVRRTILVAPQNPEVGQVIETVFVIGTGSDHQRLVQQLSKDCSAKVQLFDPLSGFELADPALRLSSGRLIPLLGMVAEEAGGGKHAVDFANPRRAPKPPNRIRQLVMGAALALTVVGTVSYYVWSAFDKAESEYKRLNRELADLTSQVKKGSEKKKITDAIEDWNSNGVVWLDELRELSLKFPPGQDLVIQRMAMTPTRSGKASISFQGLARESKVVARMEASLRDSRHEVQTPRVEERVNDKMYSWSFDTAISLIPSKKDADDPKDKDRAP